MNISLKNLPSRFVVFDTEYTTWEGAMERDWKGPGEFPEVVQIGAVKTNNDTFSEDDTFSIFAKPKKNPKLSPFFTELTKIAQEEVDEKGVSFPGALSRFVERAGGLPFFCWGRDCDMLKKNCDLNDVPFPFEKEKCQSIIPVFEAAGIDTSQYKSSTIVEAFGEEPALRAHDGLNDARQIVRALALLKKRTEGEA